MVRHQVLERMQTRVLHSELDTAAFTYEFTVDRTIVNHVVDHGMNSKYFPQRQRSGKYREGLRVALMPVQVCLLFLTNYPRQTNKLKIDL